MSRWTAAVGECPFNANQSFEPLGTRQSRATLASSIRCRRVANSRTAHCRSCSRSKKAAAETNQRVFALGEYSYAHPPEGFVQRPMPSRATPTTGSARSTNEHRWRFDPLTEKFNVFASDRPGANVRQLNGRAGETWGGESGTDRLVVIQTVAPA